MGCLFGQIYKARCAPSSLLYYRVFWV